MTLELRIYHSDNFFVTSYKIASFASLPHGWHYGEGVPPTIEALQAADQINDQAARLGYRKSDAFPGIDGEVMVTIYHDKWYLEFSVEADLTVTFIAEQHGEEVEYLEKLSLSQALGKLIEYREKVWTLSGLSTPNISIITLASSSGMPSRIPATGQASQVLTSAVVSNEVEASAATSHVITPARQETPQSFGKFLVERFQMYVSSYSRLAIPATNAITT